MKKRIEKFFLPPGSTVVEWQVYRSATITRYALPNGSEKVRVEVPVTLPTIEDTIVQWFSTMQQAYSWVDEVLAIQGAVRTLASRRR